VSETQTVKAAAGRRVRHPVSARLLKDEGETVAWNSYWQRLLQDGDVELVDAPAPAVAKPAPAPINDAKAG